jgi:hypothetical protein
LALINQDVRFAERGDDNNPSAIYSQYKPTRLISSPFPPQQSFGELWHWYIDTSNGNLYVKKQVGDSVEWILEYNLGGGGVPGGINGATNVGGGAEVFQSVVGTDLVFRTLVSADASNEIIQTADTLDIQCRPNIVNFSGIGPARAVDPVLGKTIVLREFISSDTKVGISTPNNNQIDFTVQNLTKDDVGLNFLNNHADGVGDVTLTPGANTDSTQGYVKGSYFAQQGGQLKLWICTDNTAGAAVWELIYDGSHGGSFEKDMFGACASIPSVTFPDSGAWVAIPTAWTSVVSRGSWIPNLNTGFGPYAVQRNVPASGKATDLFKVTVDFTIYDAGSPSGEPQSINVVVCDSIPIAGSIVPCSGMYATAIQPAAFQIRTPASVSFLYQSSASAPFWYLAGRKISGTSPDSLIAFENVNITIVQL